MKTITFYNEKGGVGKSTLTCMYASWLKYRHNVKVTVIDMDNTQEAYRRDELASHGRRMAEAGERLPAASEMWDIVTCTKKDISDLIRKGFTEQPHALWLARAMEQEASRGTDVLIIDFPGKKNGGEFIQAAVMRLISLYCIVFDRDSPTLRCTYNVIAYLNRLKQDNRVGILTNIQPFIARRKYEDIGRSMTAMGLPVLPDMITCSERPKETDREDIMRSSIGYPDWSRPAFRGGQDIGYDNLFIDVTRHLCRMPDIDGTGAAELSFVHGLKKKDQPGRQMHGTAFPEYEMPQDKD